LWSTHAGLRRTARDRDPEHRAATQPGSGRWVGLDDATEGDRRARLLEARVVGIQSGTAEGGRRTNGVESTEIRNRDGSLPVAVLEEHDAADDHDEDRNEHQHELDLEAKEPTVRRL